MRAQALEELSPSALGRRLAAGRRRIVLPTVYAVPGAPETWQQRALAACFWSGGLASHRTAAALHGLKGFGVPTTIEVVVSRRDMRSPRPWLKIHRTTDLPAVQTTSIGSIEAKGRTFYLDFAFPAARLGIEADGYRYHGGKTDWDHDEERRTLLTLAGWRVLHVTWTQLSEKPELVTARIRDALGLDQLWDAGPG